MQTLAASGLRRSAVAAAVGFAVTAIVVTFAIRASGRQLIDVELYRSYGDRMEAGQVPYRDFAFEYPPGALPAMLAPSLVTDADTSYYRGFAAMMALVGAVAVLLTAGSLVRLGRSPQTVRRLLVVLAVSPVAFGGTILTRFDLVPVTVVAAAMLLAIAGWERAAALALGAAIAIKLYPAVLLPLLVIRAWRHRGRRRALTVAALAAGVVILAYLPFFLLSPDGVADSLSRQLGRPLHSESLGAGILLVAHHLFGFDVHFVYGGASLDVAGSAAKALATLESVALVGTLAWLWVRFARAHVDGIEEDLDRLVRHAAAALTAFVALGKVVSPQFMLWLLFALPLVAGRRGKRAGTLYALAAVATAIWFPLLYKEFIRDDVALSVLLLARGLLLVATLAVLAWPRGSVTATAPATSRSPAPGPSPGRS